MACRRYEKQIALYAGGDLPARQTTRVAAHLAGCPECSAYYRAVQLDIHRLREHAIQTVDQSMSLELERRVFAQVEEYETARASQWHRRRMVAGALSVAACLIAAAAILVAMPSHVKAPASVAQLGPTTAARETERNHGKDSETAIDGSLREASIVKLYTDDPRVVIYLISDEKGG